LLEMAAGTVGHDASKSASSALFAIGFSPKAESESVQAAQNAMQLRRTVSVREQQRTHGTRVGEEGKAVNLRKYMEGCTLVTSGQRRIPQLPTETEGNCGPTSITVSAECHVTERRTLRSL
jgi:hypothetical protein